MHANVASSGYDPWEKKFGGMAWRSYLTMDKTKPRYLEYKVGTTLRFFLRDDVN